MQPDLKKTTLHPFLKSKEWDEIYSPAFGDVSLTKAQTDSDDIAIMALINGEVTSFILDRYGCFNDSGEPMLYPSKNETWLDYAKRRCDAEINKELLIFILATASYGSFWFTAHTLKSESHLDAMCDTDGTREDKWANRLLNNGTLVIFDYLEEEDYKITLANIIMACGIVSRKYPNVWEDILSQQGDIITADFIIQIAVFGDVIYG